MNEPIRKIGMKNGQTVYELNGEQVQLQMGFNPTTVYLGFSEKGQPTFVPNRRQRRAGLQKANRRRAFGYQKRFQVISEGKNSKVITHAVIAKETGHGGATNIN